ncbi:hypothetical protein EHS25_009643 [Saitozyma podzolica]|uniref:SGNH hydrolase-type esterase domain-containing protein n=1 Tax=Saitozyma podzolica TaxID=1890683 RepID=A0A427YJS0_9TREE|nr:hypothetical protein EHS25_009643 [Saitozyma podzolica]
MANALQDCVILLGDSLTQRQDVPGNLNEMMNKAYLRKLDVINRGFGGYNSACIWPLMDHIFAPKENAATAQRVRMVTLWLGTNDSVIQPGWAHVPLADFIDHMNHFLRLLTSPTSPYTVADTPLSIVLITPTPPSYLTMDDFKRTIRTMDATREYKDAVLKIGEEWKANESGPENTTGWKIETLDFWEAMMDAAGEEVEEGLAPFYIDGVHYTSAGYNLLWDRLASLIKTKFAGRGLDFEDLSDLPHRTPWVDKVPYSSPEKIPDMMALPKFR